ncbi:MAG: hypothetical protein Q4E50_03265 [Tissierellia bacterium]|nr:hypothetical protein [Tissierellia bacterium]
MRYYLGSRISDLTMLTIRELKNNVALDVNEYIERHSIFNDGNYSLMIPFKNGEMVKGWLIVRDINVDLEFDREARIKKADFGS